MGNSHDEAIQQAYDAYDDLMLDKRYLRDNDAWGDLRIDRENGAISLLLRWKYNWIKRWDAKTDWTDLEKNAFHRKVIFVINQTWNNKIFLSVSGKSEFASKFNGKDLSFSIEIIQTDRHGYWDVVVFKIDNDDPNSFRQSSIVWNSRYVELDSKDIVAAAKCLGSSKVCHEQIGLSHELGHIIGYLADEYYSDDADKATTPFSGDASALMNIGMELRSRYMRNVIERLNRMVPGSNFFVKSVKK
ncbi:hypothetical protein [Escherichia coli]|uniref:hypothetical protein n=1 Tax=Escherichia coli TaxID=562 RepID=UPI0002A2AE89|nr:hypothetical protein [Escherichia coli]EFJ1934576.1 hypothetical protein [Escherichia coli]EHL6038063.1 hypothetical protein [Escherichia coli]ELE46479.1 hypothetical protein A1U5_00581 [Escherichia coli KTE66]MBB7337958.1 hypothetical protein [Escherichia coli]MED0210490.1 hypothetical protein [Escherichia coli]